MKIGDKVLVDTGYDKVVDIVSRVTPKQIITSKGYKFWKKNARQVGTADTWYYASLHELEEGQEEKMLEQVEVRLLRAKLEDRVYASFKGLEDKETILKVAELLHIEVPKL